MTAQRKRPASGGNAGRIARQTDEPIIPGGTDKPQGLRLSPRQARLLDALLATTAWIWREQIDRIAKASNGPDVVMRLRGKLGEDAIETERVDTLDADGRPSNPGRYRITGKGRQVVARLLGGAQ